MKDSIDHEGEEKSAAQILLVDNDKASNELVARALLKQHYALTSISSGEDALRHFSSSLYDLVILEAHLPKMSGYDVCRELRKRSSIPIIFLSSPDNADDVIVALNCGADAYVHKPFAPQELNARIKAILRRAHRHRPVHRPRQLRHDHILLDEDRQEVLVRDEPIHLTTTEFRLLKYFIENPDRSISMQELLTAVWEYDSVPDLNLIRVAISRLRSKIEKNPANPHYLKTIRKFGYRFLANKDEVIDDHLGSPDV